MSSNAIRIVNINKTGKDFFYSPEFRDLLTKYGTQFASAEFTKKNGDTRKMQFAYRIGKRDTPTGDAMLLGGDAAYNFFDKAHLSVVDLGLYKNLQRAVRHVENLRGIRAPEMTVALAETMLAQIQRKGVYRVVNFNTLNWIQMNGVRYVVEAAQ